ncbi:exodeoxyribonuclease V subunit beta [Myxococcota bacterium]|nr:exodeoxyribonuclease V subunit beta [Myxococcota bacterium]
MSAAPFFDVLEHPLGGMHLVEASAGTGKTYNITTLVLRLLLERGLEIDRILVVSFTKAATADLRGRVRARIREGLDAFEAGRSGDPELVRLLARLDHAQAAAVLRRALGAFDRAAIYTIHAFCQRALVEFAFESGEPFSVEFTEDADELYRQICRDHWATTAYPAEAGWLEAVKPVMDGPASLLDLAKHAAERPDLDVLPRQVVPLDAEAQRQLRAHFARCAELWVQGRREILDQLDYKDGGGLLKASHKPDALEAPLAALERLLRGPAPSRPALVPKHDLFTFDGLRAATRSGCRTPSHPFFQAWQLYCDLAAPLLQGDLVEVQRGLHDTARARLDAHKDRHNVRAYADLLVRLRDALDGDNGPVLADAIFRRYPAALIDEFQDTDPVQFEIFQRVYAGGRGSLFLVGDPKQAIYAFRGGDIYAYLRAAGRARRVSLGVNFRSDRALVEALGHLYRRSPRPFLDPRIPFVDVGAHHGTRIRGPSDAPEPLQLALLRAEGKGKRGQITAGWAAAGLPPLIARDVVRFLRSDARLLRGKDALGAKIWSSPSPSDVAVLTRTNAAAAAIQDALIELGVNAVASSDASVFASAEASALWMVLQAVLSPTSDRKLRAALASPLVGLDALTLYEHAEDDATWAQWAARFHALRETWERRGFAPMFRTLLVERLHPERAPAQERIVGQPRGERVMTNLLHLGELLQDRALRRSLGPVGLASWLGQRRIGGGEGADDEELRLESDAHAARVMTVYKAKGLQFPAVWYPHGHMSFKPGDVRPMFHGDPPDEQALVSLDPAEWGEQAARAAVELAAQERRVLYVALTRAAQRLTIYWGDWNQGERSALAALLHPATVSRDATPAAVSAADAARSKGLGEGGILSALQEIARGSGGGVGVRFVDEREVAPYAPQEDTTPLLLGQFDGRVRTSWRRTSYSGLTRSDEGARVGISDLDEVAEGAPAGSNPDPSHGDARPGDDDPCGFADFPRGKGPGIVLHTLFEHADFQDRGPALDTLVKDLLAERRLDAEKLAGPTAAALREVLETPLGGALAGFRLGDLPRSRRLDELSFTLSVSGRGADTPNLRQRDLVALLRRHGRGDLADRVGRLAFGRLRGHLDGVIDLVFEHDGRFWLCDYKSNFLGRTRGHYGAAALLEAIREHHYDLQYLLYLVALHRFLGQRVPGYRYDRHVGGVRYLFIRGMRPASGPARGVFADQPGEELVVALSELLRQPTGGAA